MTLLDVGLTLVAVSFLASALVLGAGTIKAILSDLRDWRRRP